MSKRRILYISRGGTIAGSQRQMLFVIEHLDRTRYEPVVVAKSGGEFVEALAALAVETVVMPMRPWRKLSSFFMRLLDARRIYKFARWCGADIIHCNDVWFSGYALWAASRLKVPCVVHIRAPISARDVRKHRCQEAQRVIAISNRSYDDAIAGGVAADKVVRIYDGVDVDLFRPSQSHANVLRRDYGLDDAAAIGIVGRIDKFKSQLDFVKAANAVVTRGRIKAKFFIIGDCHEREYCELVNAYIRQHKLEQCVILTGLRKDMPEVLGALDVLVSLSGGSVMFEAMAAGTVVLAAGRTMAEHTVHLKNGYSGVLMEGKDPDNVADAIEHLVMNSSLRQEMEKRARDYALAHLGHIHMAQRTVAVYDELRG